MAPRATKPHNIKDVKQKKKSRVAAAKAQNKTPAFLIC